MKERIHTHMLTVVQEASPDPRKSAENIMRLAVAEKARWKSDTGRSNPVGAYLYLLWAEIAAKEGAWSLLNEDERQAVNEALLQEDLKLEIFLQSPNGPKVEYAFDAPSEPLLAAVKPLGFEIDFSNEIRLGSDRRASPLVVLEKGGRHR